MKRIYFIIICILLFLQFHNISVAQISKSISKYTISGFVREKNSKETLPYANVFITKLGFGTVTNAYGFYSLTFSAIDSVIVRASFLGYENSYWILLKEGNTTLNHDFELIEKTVLLNETVVESSKEEIAENQQMSTLKLSLRQAKQIPALMGEKDLLKIFQLMPGIQKATEGTAGLYVRGGGADQNLILLDDATVYNTSHLFGFFSVFNGDAIKNMELYKGGFPARYGGRISSVLEVQMKDGNKQALHGEATLGLVSAKVMLEGPIKKDKSSFLFSARRTYFDILTKPSFAGGNATYYFYDLNLKLNHEFGIKDKIYLSSYLGKDSGSLTERSATAITEGGLNWQNITTTLRWNHLFSQKIFMNTAFVYSDYQYEVYDQQSVQNSEYNLNYSSGIKSLGLKVDLDYVLKPTHLLKMGVILTDNKFTPSAITRNETKINTNTQISQSIVAQEFGLYVDDNLQFGKLKLNIGLRFSGFNVGTKTYTQIEPRFASTVILSKKWGLKTSYARMTQFVHLLSNSGTGLPTDLWVPTTEKIQPQRGQQVAIGIYKDLTDKGYHVSLEGYYKKTEQIIAYKEGSNALLVNGPVGLIDQQKGASWEDNVTTGQGWAYGTELWIQKKTGRLTGWLGYTLAWAENQFDELNGGQKFWAKYDRRHDISVIGMYQLSSQVTLNGTWVYSSGNVFTLPLSNIQLTTPQLNPASVTTFYNISTLGERNNFRAESYHRMDVGCQFNKQKKWGERTWEISIYNLYAHLNPFLYKTKADIDTKGNVIYSLKKVSLFPILPSISYKIRF
jgi:hypothetical protein